MLDTITEADHHRCERDAFEWIVALMHAVHPTTEAAESAIEALRWTAVTFNQVELLAFWSKHIQISKAPGMIEAVSLIELAARHIRREMLAAN